MKILIVEDEKAIANLIDWNLSSCGYSCTCVYDGLTAANLIEKNTYDLILLDIMLPEINGYELLEQITPTGTPVIFVTAKGSVEDRIKGLRSGADDYLTKPFDVVELIARVETVLRRTGKLDEHYEIGDVVIDPKAMQVTKGGDPVSLTKKEYELLLLFVRNRNIALFREDIYQRVWEAEYTGDSRTVDLHVQRLKKKLGWQDRLLSVYKVGYRLEDRQ